MTPVKTTHVLTLYWILVTCSVYVTSLNRRRRTIIGSYPLCPHGCSSCSTINGCLTCSKGYYLYIERSGARQRGRCTSQCPSGYYGVSKKQLAQCFKCPLSHCADCTQDGLCTTCRASYRLWDDQCIPPCHPTSDNNCPQTKCVMSPWTEWSVCRRNGQTCGYKYGSQYRTRHAEPSGDKQCTSVSEARRCRLLYRYCSDVLSNGSEIPHTSCSRKQFRKWYQLGKWKKLRKYCLHYRRSPWDRSKHKNMSPPKLIEQKYGHVPNLKTNQIDEYLRAR